MLTHFQKRKLTRYFNILDVDTNGVLEKNDFETIADTLAEKRSIPKDSEMFEGIKAGYVMFWEDLAKQSKNGKQVTLEEWLEHHNQMLSDEDIKEKYLEMTSDVFDLFDADGSGGISLQEYRELMTSYGVAEGIPEWSFKHLDLDGNGTISKDEFVTIVEDFHLSEDLDAPGNYLFGPY